MTRRLTDDSGDLLPEVAEAVTAGRTPPHVPRPALNPAPNPAPPLIEVLPWERLITEVRRMPRPLVIGAGVALLIALSRGCGDRGDRLVPPPEPRTIVVREVAPAPPPPDAMALVGPASLHAACGAGQPEVGQLRRGEPVWVLERTLGWTHIRTEAGLDGWVFAGQILDRGALGQSAVVLCALYRAGDSAPVMTAGERVVVESTDGDHAVVLVLDGSRWRLPLSAVTE